VDTLFCGVLGRKGATICRMDPNAEVNEGRRHRRSMRIRFLWDRDGPGCFYCRIGLTENDATLDHFIPLVAGGVNALENLRVACYPCNQAKGDSVPAKELRWMPRLDRSVTHRVIGPFWRPSRITYSLADVWPTE
jgi:hypothetical protein